MDMFGIQVKARRNLEARGGALVITRFMLSRRGSSRMEIDAFRKLALSLPEAAESSHVGSADIRVRGKIFAQPPTKPGGLAACRTCVAGGGFRGW